MRLRCSNVGLLFSRRFASSSTRTTGGLVASNPPFRRIVNVAELFPSRTNGSPFAVGANAEIPAGMIVFSLFSFSMHLVNSTAHFQISMLADSSTPTDLFETGWIENGGNVEETSLWTMVALSLRGSKPCERVHRLDNVLRIDRHMPQTCYTYIFTRRPLNNADHRELCACLSHVKGARNRW